VGAEATAADTAVVLVDLSDSTNFPHSSSQTNWINVLGIFGSVETASDGPYDIWLGVISEVDASNGTAEWFDVIHCESPQNATDDKGHYLFSRDYTLGGGNPDGICCKITSGSMDYIATGQNQAGNTNWQTDVGLLSPAGAAAGATGKPGAGDIVAWVEETGGTGTCDWSLTVIYEAH
jgi:hypothetical protein